MPDVSVIVPARDAEPTLARTLRALATQDFDGRFEVLVVDDGSEDRTAELARLAGAPVRVLRQTALGPAAARNLGVTQARGSLLAFCDADVVPVSSWLRAGIRALRGADLVQGRVVPDPAARLGPFDRSLWINSQVGLWETANLFVTRSAFEAVGGFEEWIRPRRGKALAEDVWFGYRALRTGARPAFCAEALAHHAVFPRGWLDFVAERERLYYFPAMARRMPELREAFLHRRLFLNRRTSELDLALAGGLLIRTRGWPIGLLAMIPYARAVRAASTRAPASGPAGPIVAAADIAADLAGLAALGAGSVRYRSLVL